MFQYEPRHIDGGVNFALCFIEVTLLLGCESCFLLLHGSCWCYTLLVIAGCRYVIFEDCFAVLLVDWRVIPIASRHGIQSSYF